MRSRPSSNDRADWTLTKQPKSYRAPRQRFYAFRISGKTSDSRLKTRHYEHIIKSILRMHDRIGHWAHRPWEEYEREKRASRKMIWFHCSVRIQSGRGKCSVRRARRGLGMCGGDVQGLCRVKGCVLVAGELRFVIKG